MSFVNGIASAELGAFNILVIPEAIAVRINKVIPFAFYLMPAGLLDRGTIFLDIDVTVIQTFHPYPGA